MMRKRGFAVLVLAMVVTVLGMAGAGWSGEPYGFDRMWPELPQPWYFCGPSGIAVDAQGDVYVADTYNNSHRGMIEEGGQASVGEASRSRPAGSSVGEAAHTGGGVICGRGLFSRPRRLS